jgi:GTPase SAR1 family protein
MMVVDKHAQGMVVLMEQMRLGQHKGTKSSGIKKLFGSNKLHVDYMNGTLEEAQDYVKKTYNRCKVHNSKHTPCRCNLFKLDDFSKCKYCNAECCSQRTVARYDENSECVEFGTLESIMSHNKEGNNRCEYDEDLAFDKVLEDFYGGKNKEDLVNDNFEYFMRHWSKSKNGLCDIYENKKRSNKKRARERCWKPVVIYMYGDAGSGKTTLPKKLFRKIFIKDKKKWWQNYDDHEVVVLDECQKKNELNELQSFLQEFPCEVEIKNSSKPLMGKIFFLTSQKAPDQCYTKFTEGYDPEDIESLLRRLDYIIRFEGRYRDGNVRIIFEKGDPEAFKKGEFDVKFIKEFYETWDEYRIRVEDMNEGRNGQIIVKQEMEDDELVKNIYWRDNYDFAEYLSDYVNRRLRCFDTDFMERCRYRDEKRKKMNERFALRDEVIAGSSKKRSHDEIDIGKDEEFAYNSSIDPDDSDHEIEEKRKKIRLGKRVLN